MRLFLACACLFLSEALCVGRARGPLGWALPDPLLAAALALALIGRRDRVLTPVAWIALLRAPASLADPIMATVSLFALAAFVLAIRHAISRERPPVVFVVGLGGSALLALLTDVAGNARGVGAAGVSAVAASCTTTGLLTVIAVPFLRKFPWTRSLVERRFGE